MDWLVRLSVMDRFCCGGCVCYSNYSYLRLAKKAIRVSFQLHKLATCVD